MAKNSSVNLDITNNADGFDISGGTTARKLTISGADIELTGSGSNTYTYPASSDTLVGRDSTDTLTNKTINTASNTITVVAADVSDFDTEVSANTDVTTNTSKTSNANHTGEVTGSTSLTIADDIIDEANLKLETGPTNDFVLTADSTKSGGMKWIASTTGVTDHTLLTNIGSTSHVDIDTHISNTTTNPHSVDKTDVSLGNVTNDAQLPLSGDTMTGALIARDHGTETIDEVINVVYGTSATPPTANTTTEGTVYFQYTA